MRKYDADKYKRLVENSDYAMLQEFMADEINFIKQNIPITNRLVVDLGAGYGRILKYIATLKQEIVAIEINPEMFIELKKCCNEFSNCSAILGDFTDIKIFDSIGNLNNSTLLLLQNTIGTIEGEISRLIENLNYALTSSNSGIIISFFKKQALPTTGIEMFSRLTEMVGKINFEKTNFEKGEFISYDGYSAKWWSEKEIDLICNSIGSSIAAETENNVYKIVYLKN